MKIYFAPMEGITGYVFRNAHFHIFGGVDAYFSPFLATHKTKELTTREKNDILPDHNQGVPVIPQLLSDDGEDFIRTAQILKTYGYREVNLNLGCPSRTVVAKGKGAGFLARLEDLERFLDQIYSGTDMDISIKTRIGVENAEHWEALLSLFNRFPVKELIVHPRLQKAGYGGTPDRQAWEMAVRESQAPLCYNGDLFTGRQIWAFEQENPQTQAVMLGRGLLMRPGLARHLREEGETEDIAAGEYEAMGQFHRQICQGYRQVLSGDRDVLFKMKELWGYLICSFPKAPAKSLKKIQKARTWSEYIEAVKGVFASVGI